MFTGRTRSRGHGKGRGRSGHIKIVPLKGLFKSGVWHCNCDPRVPAQRFLTKKEGRNQGRWFYTCQHTEPKRCDFFLWEDDAKPREEAAVLNNSRTEPIPIPQTPVKPPLGGLSTPQSSARRESTSSSFSMNDTPSKIRPTPKSFTESRAQNDSPTPTSNGEEPEEFYDWLPSDDDELSKVTETAITRNIMPPPETPRKAQKTEMFSTPGKRRHDEMTKDGLTAWPTPISANKDDDIFTTPATNPRSTNLFQASGPPTPISTPTPRRFREMPGGQDAEVTTDILSLLQSHNVAIAPNIITAIKDIGNKHGMFTYGVIKARDISRAMIATKNEKITELQGDIAALQAERETNRAVIRHLRREAIGMQVE